MSHLAKPELGMATLPSGAAEPPAVPRRNPAAPCTLSSGQFRLWFLDQLTPGSSAYNITDMARMRGPLDISSLRASLDAIVERHEVLRTNFIAPGGLPKAVIAASRGADFRLIDLRKVPAADRESQLQQLLQSEAARPFDLAADVLLRAVVFQTGEDEYVFFHNSHHIAWDLRSKFVFYRELEDFYRSFTTASPRHLPDPPLQYSDYARWERNRLEGDWAAGLLSYWREKLAGAPARLNLATDFRRPPVLNYRAGPRVPIVLDTSLLAELQALAPPRNAGLSQALLWVGLSPFPILLAAFNVLMYAWSDQPDILVSSPYGNRELGELENLIGFFPNTLILRSTLSENVSFRDLALRALETTHGAITHGVLPFDRIVECARPARKAGQLPVVQVNFRIQKAPVPTLQLQGVSVDLPEWVDNRGSKFDLALELVMTPSLRGYFEYRADLFQETTIRQMAAVFESFLREAVKHPDVAIGSLQSFRNARKPALAPQ